MVVSEREFDRICDEIAGSYDPTCKSRYQIEKHKAKAHLNNSLIFEVSLSEQYCAEYLDKYNRLRRGEIDRWDHYREKPDKKELELVIDHAVYYLENKFF